MSHLEYSHLIQVELQRANKSIQIVNLLNQLQIQSNMVPTAIIRIPDLRIIECNSQWATMFEFSSVEELLSSGLKFTDVVLPQIKYFLENYPTFSRALGNNQTEFPDWGCAENNRGKTTQIIKTILFSRFGNPKCCSIIYSNYGGNQAVSVLSQTTHSIEYVEYVTRKIETKVLMIKNVV